MEQTENRLIRDIFSIGLLPFLVQIIIFNYTAAIPLLQREWSMNATQAGAIFSAQQIGYMVAAVVLTVLTDHIPARLIFVVSSLAAGVSNIFFALWSQNFLSALLLRTLVGFCSGGTYMPGLRAVAEELPMNKRGRLAGIFVGAMIMGSAASQSLTGSLLVVLNWRWVFIITSLGVIIVSIMSMKGIKKVSFTFTENKFDMVENKIKTFFSVLKNPAVIIMISMYCIHMWELYGVRGWISTYFTENFWQRGVPYRQAIGLGGNLSAIILAVGAVSVWIAGRFSDIKGRILTIAIFMIGGSLLSFIFGWIMFMPIWSIVIIGIIYGFFVVGDSSVISTYVIELAPKNMLGSAMAFQTLCGFFVAASASSMFGVVLDSFSSTGSFKPVKAWGLAFAMLGIITLIGSVLLLFVKNKQIFKNKIIERGGK